MQFQRKWRTLLEIGVEAMLFLSGDKRLIPDLYFFNVRLGKFYSLILLNKIIYISSPSLKSMTPMFVLLILSRAFV